MLPLVMEVMAEEAFPVLTVPVVVLDPADVGTVLLVVVRVVLWAAGVPQYVAAQVQVPAKVAGKGGGATPGTQRHTHRFTYLQPAHSM